MSHTEFAHRVRAERKKRKLTQKELAHEAHVSLRMIQTLEGGTSPGTPANRSAIARVLELDEPDKDVAAETRDDWPKDVDVFLNVIGAYLMTMPEGRRTEAIHDLTRQIFQAHQ